MFKKKICLKKNSQNFGYGKCYLNFAKNLVNVRMRMAEQYPQIARSEPKSKILQIESHSSMLCSYAHLVK